MRSLVVVVGTVVLVLLGLPTAADPVKVFAHDWKCIDSCSIDWPGPFSAEFVERPKVAELIAVIVDAVHGRGPRPPPE